MDIDFARRAFGWDANTTMTAGPRGALGQIWRVETVRRAYALKEIFSDPPPDPVIETELAMAHRTGRSPAGHPDRHGRYVVPTPQGTWLRLFDWIDLRPVDLASPRTPVDLGVLLARLHREAPRATAEPGGRPPSRWYDHVQEPQAAPALAALVAPADPADMIVCHRDLHPENVLADPSGGLVVVDWDMAGPATPSRELARALFDWFCDPAPDLAAMLAMYEAYRDAGGPGRIAQPADFSMLVANRLNFLERQRRIAADPYAQPRDRQRAEREIDESLRIMPTVEYVAAVLVLTRQTAGRPARGAR